MRRPRPITFYCEWGYHTVTEERMPGPVPTCCREHKDEARRAGVRQRVKMHREKQAQSNPPRRGPGRPRKG